MNLYCPTKIFGPSQVITKFIFPRTESVTCNNPKKQSKQHFLIIINKLVLITLVTTHGLVVQIVASSVQDCLRPLVSFLLFSEDFISLFNPSNTKRFLVSSRLSWSPATKVNSGFNNRVQLSNYSEQPIVCIISCFSQAFLNENYQWYAELDTNIFIYSDMSSCSSITM